MKRIKESTLRIMDVPRFAVGPETKSMAEKLNGARITTADRII